MLGRLSDDANLRIKGKRTNNRKLLLGLRIGLAALVLLAVIFLIALLVSSNANMYSYHYDGSYSYYDGYNYRANSPAMLPLMFMPILLFLIVALGIVTAVFTYIAIYAIYKAYSPENAEMYLVLSILISLAQPIILFCLRNKTMKNPAPYSAVDPNGYYNPAYVHPEYIQRQQPGYPPRQPGMQQPGYPPRQPAQPNGIRLDKQAPAAPGTPAPSAQTINARPGPTQAPTGQEAPKAPPSTPPVQPPREDQLNPAGRLRQPISRMHNTYHCFNRNRKLRFLFDARRFHFFHCFLPNRSGAGREQPLPPFLPSFLQNARRRAVV
ncbi:MAG: hypothetical protein ACLSAP_10535 [Oscillospiraceae bacterium]